MVVRPKRRKSKDNPYTLNVINNKYYIFFQDSNLKTQSIEVEQEIYEQIDKFELHDLKELNEFDRHIEHLDLLDEEINKRAIYKQTSIEETVEKNIRDEQVRTAINSLSDIQKRRIIKYYFEGKNEYEIAKEEGATHQSVHISLERAKEKLKEILKNLKI